MDWAAGAAVPGRRRRVLPGALLALLALLWLPGCSDAPEWRELRPEGFALSAAIPCRPARHGRQVTLAGQRVEMTLLACDVGGATFGISQAAMATPDAVAPALAELLESARTNIRGRSIQSTPAAVPGMTPNAHALRATVQGLRLDGTPLQLDLLVFAYGLRVTQLTQMSAPGTVGAREFFDGVRVVP